MNKLKVAGATLNQTPIDWKNNVLNIKTAISLAQQKGIDFLCLPELCITGYNCEDIFLSEWVTKTAVEKLLEIKDFTADICVSVGLPMLFEGNLYNVVCLISNKEILGFTPKQFLANDGVHYEHRWFVPGKSGFNSKIEINGVLYPFGDIIYEVKGIRIGFEICEDAWRGKERPGYSLFKKGMI